MHAITLPSTAPQKASRMLGASVVTSRGVGLGQIEDIVMDPKSGAVMYCVLSFGGFLGMGKKLFAISLTALVYDVSEDEYVLDIDKQHMAAAAGFDANHWPAYADEQWGTQNSSFFNTPPYWNNTPDKQNGGRSSNTRR